MKLHVNETLKEVCAVVGTLTQEEKDTILRLAEMVKKMDDVEKQRLLDIGTGMVAMKEKVNENKSKETGKTS